MLDEHDHEELDGEEESEEEGLDDELDSPIAVADDDKEDDRM